ncbi:MAG: methyltransferase domain-containing protein [Flavobacteriales bacterium]|nr:methyltransferase domain-containing protein [Flavobacteriales bacterium]
MKKLEHRNLVIGIHDALQEALFTDKYADKVIEQILKKNKKWGSKDRAFVAETFYEIIRWKKRIEFYSGKELNPTNLYNIIATYFLYKKIDFPIWEEFKGFYHRKVKERFKLNFPSKSIEHSIPKWMEKLLIEELGENSWEKEIIELNKPAKQVLRTNTLKITKDELIKELEAENIQVQQIDGYDDALELIERKNVFISESFKKGYFEMQDASSQLVANFMELDEKMRVVDACAGAGGKSLHMASLMKNKGQIIAMDIHAWKLKELKLRARRAGVHNIQTKIISDTKAIKRLENSADRLLLDAPCSGMGVLRRNPDSKWKLNPEFIERMIKTQEEILQSYSKIVKSGGKLIYATCSILPSENRKQIDSFLEKNSNFIFEDDQIILPSATNYDGFYMARMRKK